MASVSPATSASTGVTGPRIPPHMVRSPSQENTSASKNRPPDLQAAASGSMRTPLSSVAPNRKDGSVNGRPSHSRVEELGQQDGHLTRSGSEADSLLDLYRSHASSGNVSPSPGPGPGPGHDNDIPENMYRPDPDDPEGWIHRDKLAKIENEELQAAGINLANARRNVNKAGKRDTSRGRRGEDQSLADHRKIREDSRNRFADPVKEEGDDDDERAHWDLRTPDEIAAEREASPIYSPTLKKSGSKIPVLTSSPLPIPQESLERDTPMVRKRTISNSMSAEDGIPVLKTRTRKGSAASSPLDDHSTTAVTPTPTLHGRTSATTSSPTKSRVKPAQPSPPSTAAGRKTSTPARKTSTPNKTGPTPTSNPRPGTRSGEWDRPRTAINRPEGDPPWLATMYKPDPMLPPDQQIIPTHARRQQQAQWQQEGAIPSTYDRNFSPLAIHTGHGVFKEPSPSPSPDKDARRDPNAWPLKPVPSARNSGSGRPGTGSSANAGYSTMPRVTSPPIVHSPRVGSISAVPAQSGRLQVQRMEPSPAEEKSRDRSCGCCVVM